MRCQRRQKSDVVNSHILKRDSDEKEKNWRCSMRDKLKLFKKESRASGNDAHCARKAALSEEAQRVLAEQRAREERIIAEARRVSEQQANAGRAWQQVQFNEAEVEKRLREAEERVYARAMRETTARAATVKTSLQPHLPTASSVVVQASGATKIPLAKDLKLNIPVLTGKDLRKGLGADFKH
uniref:Uncharacterized protein n=1 Tax=Hyaloperonospora arabidopsidis (strain Emoy2) TaxID=559515 RepID=M4BED2_HYAAE